MVYRKKNFLKIQKLLFPTTHSAPFNDCCRKKIRKVYADQKLVQAHETKYNYQQLEESVIALEVPLLNDVRKSQKRIQVTFGWYAALLRNT